MSGVWLDEDEKAPINVPLRQVIASERQDTVSEAPQPNGTHNTLIGSNANVIKGSYNTVIGPNSVVLDGDRNLILGSNNTVKGSGNVVLGNDYKVEGNNQLIRLGQSQGITDFNHLLLTIAQISSPTSSPEDINRMIYSRLLLPFSDVVEEEKKQ